MHYQKNRELVRAFWNSTGPWRMTYFSWLQESDPAMLPPALRLEREFVIREQELLDSEVRMANRVAELGCGVGRSILPGILAHPATLFVGMDFAQHQVRLFQDRLSSCHVRNALAVISEVERLPIAGDSMDLVLVCNQTFGTFLGPSREAVLIEMNRILRHGGRALIGGFTAVHHAPACYAEWGVSVERLDSASGLVELEHYNSLWEPEENLSALVTRAGFEAVRSEHVELGFISVYKKVAPQRL